MFDLLEGEALDSSTYEAQVAELRADLLDAQYELLDGKHASVVVLINGVDGAGKGETVNLLAEWMDTRHLRTEAFVEPTAEEAQRPPLWRFWRALPPKGKISVLFGNWYTMPILGRALRSVPKKEFAEQVDEIRRFERLLHEEGVVLIKLWFHLSKKQQRKRLQHLEKHRHTRWRVTERDWANFAKYDRFAKISARVLDATTTEAAPWHVVDGSVNGRALVAGRAILEALRAAKSRGDAAASHASAAANVPPPPPSSTVVGEMSVGAHRLRTLPFSERLSKERYEPAIEAAQARLNGLARRLGGIVSAGEKAPSAPARGVVVVFEGMDAAGKGGAIRRITHALDARAYGVVPIAAPTPEERAFPYLWRFWKPLPGDGRVLLFDRSWYGRVLVERVEGFASERTWTRGYQEIVDFEGQLLKHGYVLAKFWLAVSKAEQLKRFQEREHTRFKRFKITPEDWRNRDKWDAYQGAAGEMLDHTHTAAAPWTIVEADDKHLARVQSLETLADQIAAALGD
jgi:polyphosphate:AMP phosphotransferase